MTIEIVDFPIDSVVIFHSYVSLPEGIPDAPCMEYESLHLLQKLHSFVGKYSSTMEHMGIETEEFLNYLRSLNYAGRINI